jgi:hypothetical protein
MDILLASRSGLAGDNGFKADGKPDRQDFQDTGALNIGQASLKSYQRQHGERWSHTAAL